MCHGDRVGSGLHKIFGRSMPCSMYSSLLLEQAGSAHFRNEQTTVAQPAAGPTERYPSVAPPPPPPTERYPSVGGEGTETILRCRIFVVAP